MEIELAISSMVLILLANSGIAALFLFFIPTNGDRCQLNSIRYFRGYFVFSFLGFFMVAMRPYLPFSPAVVVANSFLILSVHCLVCGIYWRYGKSIHLTHPVIATHILIFAFIHWVISYYQSDHALARITFTYLNMTGVLLFSLSLFSRYRPEAGTIDKILEVALGAAVFCIVLIPITFFAVPDEQIFLAVLLMAQIVLIFLMFGSIFYTLFYDALRLFKKSASLDPITELYNRRYFFEQASKFLYAAERHQFPVSIIVCDIDRFASVNDEHGHFAGDFVIKEMAKAIKDETRKEDLVARYGGKEFVALLPQTRLNGALLIAERMRQKIEEMQIQYQEKVIQLTASFGVSCISEFTDIESSLRTADLALRKAKQAGFNRVYQSPVEPLQVD